MSVSAERVRREQLKTLMETIEYDSVQMAALTGYHAVVIRQWRNGDKVISRRTLRYIKLLVEKQLTSRQGAVTP